MPWMRLRRCPCRPHDPPASTHEHRWWILAAAGMVVIRGEAGARNTVVTPVKDIAWSVSSSVGAATSWR